MTDGEKAGCWAMVYLCIALFGVWFIVFALSWYHIKELFA